jgi:hypothetical protein
MVNDVGGITFCAGGIPALLRYNTAPLIAGTVGGVAYGLSAAALGFGYDKIGYASGIGISLGVAGVSATRAFTTKRPFPTLFLSGWLPLFIFFLVSLNKLLITRVMISCMFGSCCLFWLPVIIITINNGMVAQRPTTSIEYLS